MAQTDFVKMNGTGNDFVMIDNREKTIIDASSLAIKLCKRRTSIGADGLILLERSEIADVRMNTSIQTSEVSMCGNGARCTAYFSFMLGFPEVLSVETQAGVIKAEIRGNHVNIDMPESKIDDNTYKVEYKGEKIKLFSADTGVPTSCFC
jgi:diaminopimelate epimerase